MLVIGLADVGTRQVKKRIELKGKKQKKNMAMCKVKKMRHGMCKKAQEYQAHNAGRLCAGAGAPRGYRRQVCTL